MSSTISTILQLSIMQCNINSYILTFGINICYNLILILFTMEEE